MTTLQKQQFFEHTIYATIAILIFATPIINALLMAYQTNGKTEITRPAIDMWIITSPFFFLFLINNYVLIPVLLLKKQYAGYVTAVIFIIPLLFIIIPEVQVPPLLFISLLENAFTHGISHCDNSFIDASIHVEGDSVYFTCKNSLAHQSAATQHQGIGLPNIQKRLNLLFGNNYTLNAERKDNQYRVLLIIPAQ